MINQDKHIIIYGSFGDGNVGDEAYYEILMRELYTIDNDLKFVILSKDDKPKRKVKNIKDVPLYVINQAHCLIMGGGHIVARNRSMIHSLEHIINDINIPIILLGAGCTDGYKPEDLLLYQKAFAKATYISVRNKKSQDVLQSIMGAKYDIVPDIVFALPNIDTHPLPKKAQTVGIVPLPLYGNYVRELCKLFWKLKDNNIQPVIIDFYSRYLNMWKAYSMITGSGLITPKKQYNVFFYYQKLKEFDLVIAHRLHSLILSALAHVPFIGYNYQSKIHEIGNQLGCQEDIVAYHRLNMNSKNYGYDTVEFNADATYDKIIVELQKKTFKYAVQVDMLTRQVKKKIRWVYEEYIR